MSRAYLDHAASSVVGKPVLAAMSGVWREYGNPSSLHGSGRAMRRRLEEARESIAADLGAHPTEVVLTSGGTEANNLALLGAAGDGEVLISAVEHPSVAEARQVMGERVRVLEVDEAGAVTPAQVRDAVEESTRLVSVMWVNNETGLIEPVRQLADAAHEAGAFFHTDAVQAVGHVPVSFEGIDLMTVSAHKVGGPVGVGALLVRRGVMLRPTGFGGGQEAKLRSGTVPVALAVGFATALHEAVERQESEAQRLGALKAVLLQSLRRLPDVKLNTVPESSPAIVNATFLGTRADDLLLLLDSVGIDCSTGSACTAGVHQPSDVLLAMGRTLAEASASLRFSFGPSTTSRDIDLLVRVLPDALARARSAFA